MRASEESERQGEKEEEVKLKIPEKDIQKAILQYLELRGHMVWRTNTGTMFLENKGKQRMVRFGFPGLADILGVRKGSNGQFLAIEVKRPGNQASESQATFLCKVADMGGLAFVAWSVDDCIKRGL